MGCATPTVSTEPMAALSDISLAAIQILVGVACIVGLALSVAAALWSLAVWVGSLGSWRAIQVGATGTAISYLVGRISYRLEEPAAVWERENPDEPGLLGLWIGITVVAGWMRDTFVGILTIGALMWLWGG